MRAILIFLKSIFLLPSLLKEEKVLRFNRALQAQRWMIFAGILLCLSLLITLYAWLYPHWNDLDKKLYLWAFLVFLAGGVALRVGLQCLRASYIVLTGAGLELFSLFFPKRSSRVVFWSEITEVEHVGMLLILHTHKEKTSGVVLTLKGLLPDTRRLLLLAIDRRLASLLASREALD